MNRLFDVVVIGGGHAGTEAAAAAARLGAKTLLLTQKLSTIGQMSCNPSIGGIGKGQLIREIDALGGLIGRVADLSSIQFKALNRSKGAAVLGLRAQMDRQIYRKTMLREILQTENLTVIEGSVKDLIVEDGRLVGVKTDQAQFKTSAAVLTTGTFLRGRIHIGQVNYPAGRHLRNSSQTEPPSNQLSETLMKNGFEIGRLTTGTPPRISKKSIDFSKTSVQSGDKQPLYFSHLHQWQGLDNKIEQLDCYITNTNQQTHKIVESYRYLLPKFSVNEGKGLGPRYCPSIEKKLVRFPGNLHQVWLQPQGLDSQVIYPNGLSTCLPQECQIKMLRSIRGLQAAQMLRPGYCVEYDYCSPKTLKRTFETAQIKGFFLAGQINGTSGYQQAAAQGLIAGINAGLLALNREQVIFKRNQAFLGVLLDDLINFGGSQPYRMFSSRSQYRLQLRPDNADLRMSPLAVQLGLLSTTQKNIFFEKKAALENAQQRLKHFCKNSMEWYKDQKSGQRLTGWQVLGRQIGQYQSIFQQCNLGELHPSLKRNLAIKCKYQPYSLKILKNYEKAIQSGENIEVSQVTLKQLQARISKEQYEKLMERRPRSVGAASKLGLRPQTIVLLSSLAKQRSSTQSL